MEFLYTGIRVKNLEESKRFYTEILGMKVVREGKTENGIRVSMKSPKTGHALELNWYNSGSVYNKAYISGEELDHLAFSVKNLERFLSNVKKKGIKLLAGPFRGGGWANAFIKDPNGIWIELLES